MLTGTGTTAVVMDGPPAGASAEFVAAWQRRMIANAEGVCPACGATVAMPNRGQRRKAKRKGTIMWAVMRHDDGCPVSDENLRRRYRADLS